MQCHESKTSKAPKDFATLLHVMLQILLHLTVIWCFRLQRNKKLHLMKKGPGKVYLGRAYSLSWLLCCRSSKAIPEAVLQTQG